MLKSTIKWCRDQMTQVGFRRPTLVDQFEIAWLTDLGEPTGRAWLRKASDRREAYGQRDL
jgi:hypothetical protein